MKAEMKKGFTIAELMVAVAIMAIALAAMGWIFKMAIDAQRISSATAEIASSYRAITDQLNSDFAGLNKKCGLFTTHWLYTDKVKPYNTNVEVRGDGLVFFANGNFQTVRQYDPCSTDPCTISGNEAKIFYGFSALPDPNDISGNGNSTADYYEDRAKQVLLRIQTIYTTQPGLVDPNNFVKTNFPMEYERGASFNSWRIEASKYTDPNVIAKKLTGRIAVDINNLTISEVPYIFGRGVAGFAVKFDDGFEPNGVIRWWPENEDIHSNTNIDTKKYKDRYRLIKFEFTLCSKTKINGKPLRKSFSHIIDLRED